MRLCKPSLQVDTQTRLDLSLDLLSDADAVKAIASGFLPERPSDRSNLGSSLDAFGVDGLLELPVAFGTIYLGETFCSYISLGKYSAENTVKVTIKAELQTERQTTTLYDNSAAPLACLAPGQRHDFIIRHDVKEVGQHTLVCTSSYTRGEGAAGEAPAPQFLPQYFKFLAHNPLSVRTKTRAVGSECFLEACVENAAKAPLVLDYVRFDPTPVAVLAAPVLRGSLPAEAHDEEPLGDYVQSLQVIDAGCAANFVYRLSSAGEGALGKLEIRWRSQLGDSGRLQTQQILAAPSLSRDASLAAVSLPASVPVEQPFPVRLRVQSRVDAPLRWLHLCAPAPGAASPPGGPHAPVVLQGMGQRALAEMMPQGTQDVEVTLVALRRGVQALPALQLTDDVPGRLLDTLAGSVLVV
ncbi:hypothetical protein WJX81_003565 [Elliptochloris bilobata]|uniref:Trafficking protein particle complex subunit 13 n=1 Tax=Elliptochloris bilobata TaxID=381761 RepID=A0AAW1QN58_9CHLO